MKREFGDNYAYPVDLPSAPEDDLSIIDEMERQEKEEEDAAMGKKDPDD